jgi:hypothetical protein
MRSSPSSSPPRDSEESRRYVQAQKIGKPEADPSDESGSPLLANSPSSRRADTQAPANGFDSASAEKIRSRQSSVSGKSGASSQPARRRQTTTQATPQDVVTKAFMAHRMQHKLAQDRLQAVTQEVPMTHRLDNLAKGHCLLLESRKAASRMKTDPNFRRLASQQDSTGRLGAWSSGPPKSFFASDADGFSHSLKGAADTAVATNRSSVESCTWNQGKNYVLQNFAKVIQDETVQIQVPLNEQPPLCSCGTEMSLRKNKSNDREDHLQQIWVCATYTCMIWCPYGQEANLKSIMDNLREAEAAQDELWNVSDDDEPHRSVSSIIIEVPEQEPEQELKPVTQQEIENYWAEVDPNMSLIDEDTYQIICNLPAAMACCLITGDIFYVCSPRTCMYIEANLRRRRVEEKFGRNFRVNVEMRDEILVYDSFL